MHATVSLGFDDLKHLHLTPVTLTNGRGFAASGPIGMRLSAVEALELSRIFHDLGKAIAKADLDAAAPHDEAAA